LGFGYSCEVTHFLLCEWCMLLFLYRIRIVFYRSPDESSTPAGDSTIPKVEPVPVTPKEGESVMEGVQEEKPKDQELGEEEEESNEDSKSGDFSLNNMKNSRKFRRGTVK
jgi:hypothetical protein